MSGWYGQDGSVGMIASGLWHQCWDGTVGMVAWGRYCWDGSEFTNYLILIKI